MTVLNVPVCHSDRVWLQGLLLHVVLEFAWWREHESQQWRPCAQQAQNYQDGLLKGLKVQVDRKFGYRYKSSFYH